MQHPPKAPADAPEAAERSDGQARLLAVTRRRLAELATVQRVAQAITSAVRLDELCATVVEQVGQAFGYRLVSIYLREGRALHLQAAVGYEHVLTTIGLEQGVSGRVVRTGQPCFVRDASAEPDFLHAVPGLRQGIFVPLRFADEPALGMIAVESGGEPALTDDDLTILALLADQTSVAVVNARLFDQREEAASRFRALMESTGNVIVGLTPDLRITAFNCEAERVFGRAPAEALGQSYLERFVAPADRPAVAALASAAIVGAGVSPIETVVAAADGSERTFRWTIASRSDRGGAIAPASRCC